MDWMWLSLGVVLGSLITSVLIWAQRGTRARELEPSYFARVALSVVITALLAGLARLALEYARAGGLSATGIWFGGGWLLGDLLAGSLLSTRLQQPEHTARKRQSQPATHACASLCSRDRLGCREQTREVHDVEQWRDQL